MQFQDCPQVACTAPRLDFTEGALTVRAGHYPPGPRLHRPFFPSLHPQAQHLSPEKHGGLWVFILSWSTTTSPWLGLQAGRLQRWKGEECLRVMRSEALGSPKIPEESLGRITPMPLTRPLDTEYFAASRAPAPFLHSFCWSVRASGPQQAAGTLSKPMGALK